MMVTYLLPELDIKMYNTHDVLKHSVIINDGVPVSHVLTLSSFSSECYNLHT